MPFSSRTFRSSLSTATWKAVSAPYPSPVPPTRLRTNRGQVAGTGEGYGAETAFHVAVDTLERNVLELKGTRADAEYEGQVLRKLGEL